MGEPVDPNLDEMIAANARAFEKARAIADDFKALVEHEVLNDDSIVKTIEISPRPENF